MAISVKEIQEKEFPIQAEGYNIEQVDDYLDEIVEYLSAVLRENMALKGRVGALEEEVATKTRELEEAAAKTPDYNEAGYFKNLQNAMRETLISAQRLADETTAKANGEAETTVAAAKAEAEKLVADAKAEAESTAAAAQKALDEAKAETEALKGAAESYRASFRKLVEDQLATLKANDLLFK
ncbi:MAG: DivIVA domain-containing protein [Clostridia bacterium]|nr:DivIVA domain-containing protein [Clostridia bacterium]